MGVQAFGLAELIDPVSKAEFLGDFFEQRPLFIRGSRTSESQFSSLLSLPDIDRIIANSDLRYPCFRLAKDGVQLPTGGVTRSMRLGVDLDDDIAHSGVIYDHVCGGASLILQSLEHYWEPIANLCSAIQEELPVLTETIQANAYLTPIESRGFDIHYDTHDVLVLQLRGTKTWRVWEDPVGIPLTSQKSECSKAQILELASEDRAILKLELRPGDLLYIPRGFLHVAHTEGDISLHLTVGLIAPRLSDVAKEVVRQTVDALASGSDEFRRTPSILSNDAMDHKANEMTVSVRKALRIDDAIAAIRLGREGTLRMQSKGRVSELVRRLASG